MRQIIFTAMQSAVIDFNSSVVHYRYHIGGKHLLICFHGYGESADEFDFLQSYLDSSFSILAFDMPHHGNTIWKDDKINAFEFTGLIDRVRTVHALNDVRITFLGYSMGCRIALACFERKSADTKQLILLAPDGLKINFWYWFATQTWFGNKIFFITISRPGWFLGILKASNALRLLNPSVYKFVLHFLDDEPMRRLLYLRWTSLSIFRPSINRIKNIIRKNNVSVHLIYGKYDRIILRSVGERFRKGIESNCTIDLLDTGHRVLQETHVHEIIKHLSMRDI
ncbi:MAG: alpha/beta hydrolase [Chitinophagaceae bacterium]|nr:alpha/beta hydrolase [Chitinophagaceae bacterium]